jgi:hypothetical protein
MSEMESLNLEDLDVDQLERRVELSTVALVEEGGGGDGGGGGCTDYNSTCVGLCSSLCGCNSACGIDFW